MKNSTMKNYKKYGIRMCTCLLYTSYLFVDSDTILKKCFADVPEKYVKLKKNLEQKVFALDQKNNKRAAELMQMIIEEEQLSLIHI